MTKVFAFDIDGTFLNDKHEVQQEHIVALTKAKEAGHHVVLCSGRPYFDMIPVLEQVPEGLFRYLICNNGAYIVDLETNERYMEKEVPQFIIEDFEKLSTVADFGFAIHTLNYVQRGKMWKGDKAPAWFSENNENMEEKSKKFVSWEEAKKNVEGERIAQLSIIGEKSDIAKALDFMKSKEHDVDIHIAGEIYLDVNPDGVSKMLGIQNLGKILNIPTDNFVVFGDSGNDLQMLEGAGLGVAMGNATVEAKSVADVVIGSNNTPALADKVLELI